MDVCLPRRLSRLFRRRQRATPAGCSADGDAKLTPALLPELKTNTLSRESTQAVRCLSSLLSQLHVRRRGLGVGAARVGL